MLIIPLAEKISWRRPPIITILLILANIFIFFLFQYDYDERYARAYEFYFESGLAEIELNAYAAYLAGNDEKIDFQYEAEDLQAAFELYSRMRADNEFQNDLKTLNIIDLHNKPFSCIKKYEEKK